MLNTIDIDSLEDFLLNVDVESFTKDMQHAISNCPQGHYDETAKYAKFYKNIYHQTPLETEVSRRYCLENRVRLFSLKDSKTLSGAGYFVFLNESSKEIYHLAKIYEHLFAIKKIKVLNEIC